jgi:hypothetical protein
MMRFAGYYGFTFDCNCNIAAYNLVIVGRNLPETCSGLNLARRLGTAGLNLRPVSMTPMGGRTWPNKPSPNGVWAVAQVMWWWGWVVFGWGWVVFEWVGGGGNVFYITNSQTFLSLGGTIFSNLLYKLSVRAATNRSACQSATICCVRRSATN